MGDKVIGESEDKEKEQGLAYLHSSPNPPLTPQPRGAGGPKGPEPTRYGDWEINGKCVDFLKGIIMARKNRIILLFAIIWGLVFFLTDHREENLLRYDFDSFNKKTDTHLSDFVTTAHQSGMPEKQVEAVRQLALNLQDDVGSYNLWALTSLQNHIMWIGIMLLILIFNLENYLRVENEEKSARNERLLWGLMALFVVMAIWMW